MSYPPGNKDLNETTESLVDSADDPMADNLIGFDLAERYRIIRLLGTGGWGNVYLAKHLTLGTDVAIKIIHKHLSGDEGGVKRLEQEAQLLNRLDSPNIVRIIDYGLVPFPYIVMEFFDGTPLNTWLKQNGALDLELALELFTQICDGMSNARELGLVHRDLKPGNILIKIEDTRLKAKILDFGIAKLTEDISAGERLTTTGEILGSPPYMSPEQWTGRADHRSDIYSLGCIMYEVLSGKPAFTAQYGIDYLNKHVHEYPPRMKQVASGKKLPAVMDDIVRKCILKSPDKRYQTSSALKADLEQIKSGRTVKIKLPSDDKLFCPKNIIIASSLTAIGATALWFEHEPIASEICKKLNADGDKLKSAGKIEDAIGKYRQTIMFAQVLPKQDKQKLHALRMLALALKERKEWKESESIDKQITALTGATVSPTLAQMIGNCNYQKSMGNLKAADTYSRQALSEAAILGTHSLAYSAALDARGAILRLEGHLDQALKTQTESLVIAEDLLEPECAEIAERLNNLGQVFTALQQYENAERVEKQSLVINTKLGKLDEVSTNMNNIAVVYFRLHKYAEASDWYLKALELCRKNHGSNGTNILNNLAQMNFFTGDYKASVDYFKQCLELRKKEGIDQTPDSEVQWRGLGKAYIKLKDFKNAEPCLIESLSFLERNKDLPGQYQVLDLLVQLEKKLNNKDAEKTYQDKLNNLNHKTPSGK